MQVSGQRWSVALSRMPWATLLPLLGLLPFVMSGALRYLFGWSIGIALGATLTIAACGSIVAAFYGLPRLTAAQGPYAPPLVFAAALIAVAVCFRLWWTPLYGGLPNTFQGVDVGNHLLIYQRFTIYEHREYQGFVALYAMMHPWKQLLARSLSRSASIYYSLRFAHYAFLMALPVALALVVYPVLARLKSARQEIAVAALSLPVQLAALAFLIFPVTQYFQADGFYSQIAGLYPLLLGWLFYGLVEHAGTRFVLCLAWVVVQRFTYGLNLSDLLITLAYLFATEAHRIRPRLLRYAAYAFVPVACYTAWTVWRRLWPLRGAKGYFIDYEIGFIIASEVLIGVLLLAAPMFFTSAKIQVAEASQRLWRYAGVMGVVTGMASAIYFALGAPHLYYINKYGLYATVILSLAMVGAVSTVISHLVTCEWGWWRRPESARALYHFIAMVALGCFGICEGYAVYARLARERFLHTTPNQTLFSHYEPAIEAFIDRTLAASEREFGGYYDPFWPRMFTHNTLRWFFSHAPDFTFNHDFIAGRFSFFAPSGYCYFMRGTPNDYEVAPETATGSQLREFYAARTRCTTFQPTWSATEYSLCATCL